MGEFESEIRFQTFFGIRFSGEVFGFRSFRTQASVGVQVRDLMPHWEFCTCSSDGDGDHDDGHGYPVRAAFVHWFASTQDAHRG